MASARRLLTPAFVIGVGVIAAGILFLYDNFGYRTAGTILGYWPVVLIAVGLLKLVSARSVPAAIGASIWALIGMWILSDRVQVLQPTVAGLLKIAWPMVLVGLGFVILRRALSGERIVPAEPADFVDVTAIAAGVNRVVAATDFKGGDITAIFGGSELDLRRTVLHKQAMVDVFTLFGGVELTVPESWAVEPKVTSIFGGVEDKTRPSTDPGAPRLIVSGTVIFGGLQLKN
jgi:predicted membrane protein